MYLSCLGIGQTCENCGLVGPEPIPNSNTSLTLTYFTLCSNCSVIAMEALRKVILPNTKVKTS